MHLLEPVLGATLPGAGDTELTVVDMDEAVSLHLNLGLPVSKMRLDCGFYCSFLLSCSIGVVLGWEVLRTTS